MENRYTTEEAKEEPHTRIETPLNNKKHYDRSTKETFLSLSFVFTERRGSHSKYQRKYETGHQKFTSLENFCVLLAQLALAHNLIISCLMMWSCLRSLLCAPVFANRIYFLIVCSIFGLFHLYLGYSLEGNLPGSFVVYLLLSSKDTKYSLNDSSSTSCLLTPLSKSCQQHSLEVFSNPAAEV